MEEDYFNEKLYDLKNCELKQLFAKRRKRKEEMERKKKILSIMYDEIEHIHREVDLMEKQLSALDQDYFATRDILSSITENVPSDNLDTLANREESYIHYQVNQVNSEITAECVLEMIRRRQVALQYLASVTYCKYLEHKHNLADEKKKQIAVASGLKPESELPEQPRRLTYQPPSEDIITKKTPLSRISTRELADLFTFNVDMIADREGSSPVEESGGRKCTVIIKENEEA